MDQPERLVITGLGAVTPIGVGVGAFTRAMREGRSGVRPLCETHPEFDDPRVRSTVSACVPESVFQPAAVMDAADTSRLPRLIPMGVAAAHEAIAMAGLDPTGDLDASRRVGLVLGTGGGGIDFTLDQAATYAQGRRGSLWTITNATHGNLAGELSIRLGLRGLSWCVTTGCASSSDALGAAMLHLRAPRHHPGALDSVVVVGADAHVRAETLAGMELLGVISTRDLAGEGEDPATASRPFDRTRDGFVLGEGAWAVVLERDAAARERGANPVALALGYGATCDAHHRVRPDPEMTESVRAMRVAIEDAGVRPEEVEVVHYHGTGTRMNDALETRAVKGALGDDNAQRVRGTSIKSQIGHPQGACGLAAVVGTIGSLTGADGGDPFVAPTINLSEPDLGGEEFGPCDLDYTPIEAAPTEARTALVNCLAFGAKNSALLLRATRA